MTSKFFYHEKLGPGDYMFQYANQMVIMLIRQLAIEMKMSPNGHTEMLKEYMAGLTAIQKHYGIESKIST